MLEQQLKSDNGNRPAFSEIFPNASYNIASRKKKAHTIHTILCDYLSNSLKNLSILDIGSSTGAITHYLSKSAGSTVGIDVDKPAVFYAKKHFKGNNLVFFVCDSMHLPFANDSFDVVVCAHVYEHVPNAHTLMAEIHRVLKNNGICYFAAGNRISLVEPHYNLPLLSLFPKPIAHIYLKAAGRGERYLEKHLTYRGLKKLTKQFECIDYTKPVIEDPDRFHTGYMIKRGTLKSLIANLVVRHTPFLCPGYIWVLRKHEKT